MLRITPVVDGFSLNVSIRPRMYWYYPMALGSMDVLRKSNTYRAKLHVLPDSYNQPIPAYETREYQIRLTPNSYVWGLLANQFTVDQGYAKVAPTFLCQITDSCNGIPFFEDFVAALAFHGNQTVLDHRNLMLPHLFTQPRLVLEPGLLAVEMANRDATAVTCQLILFTAEPCEAIVQ